MMKRVPQFKFSTLAGMTICAFFIFLSLFTIFAGVISPLTYYVLIAVLWVMTTVFLLSSFKITEINNTVLLFRALQVLFWVVLSAFFFTQLIFVWPYIIRVIFLS